MTEYKSDRVDDDDVKGGLEPAPVTPTEEKEDPEAGTESADKRSPESQAEQQDGPSSPPPGASGGDVTE